MFSCITLRYYLVSVAESTTTQSSNNFTIIYEYLLGAELLIITMSVSKESDAGFPWFEEQNFTYWLVQFRAHLRKSSAHVVLDRPRSSDLDAQGNPNPTFCTFNDGVT